MRVQLRKVIRDLWIYRIRCGLSVFAIAVGLIVFGSIATTRVIVIDSYDDIFRAANPAQVVMQIPNFDDGLVRRVADVDEIQSVDARSVISNLRMQIATDEWVSIDLHAAEDFSALRLHQIFAEPETVGIVPQRGTIWLDRSIQLRNPLQVGDFVLVETPMGELSQLQISGFINDVIAFPSQLSDIAVGYVSIETLRDMKLATYTRPSQPAYNQLYLRFARPTDAVIEIRRLVALVEDEVSKAGYQLISSTYLTDKPPLDAQTSVIDALLVFSTILTFGVTGVMIGNFVSAIVGRQSNEIAIMKSLGAVPTQIIVYFSIMMILLGIIAFIISIPLTGWVAQLLSDFLASTIDIDAGQAITPMYVRIFQFLSALIIPLLAAFIPVVRGSIITVRETLRNDGNATSHLPRILVVLPQLFVPLLVFQMAVRNIFLKPGRFLLVITSLTFPGAVFIASSGTNTALRSLDAALAASLYNYDIELVIDGHHPMRLVEQVANRVEGVAYVEAWRQSNLYRNYGGALDGPPVLAEAAVPSATEENVPPAAPAGNRPPPPNGNRPPPPAGGNRPPPPPAGNQPPIGDNQQPRPQPPEGDVPISGNIVLRGVPLDSRLVQFSGVELRDGRWLQNPDEIVLTLEGYEAFSLNVDGSRWISVGSPSSNDDKRWEVVGVTGKLLLEEGFVDLATFEDIIPLSASTIRLAIVTQTRDPIQISRIVENLREAFNEEFIGVNLSVSINEFVAQRAGRLDLITQTLTILSIMIEIVSVIGLMSTISINVRERTKSIGILRSLGGDYRHLITMIVTESMVIVMTSYIIALPISFIMGQEISNILSQSIYSLPSEYMFEWESAAIWLVLMVAVGIVAALGPAIYAVNLTISDTLRYES